MQVSTLLLDAITVDKMATIPVIVLIPAEIVDKEIMLEWSVLDQDFL